MYVVSATRIMVQAKALKLNVSVVLQRDYLALAWSLNGDSYMAYGTKGEWQVENANKCQELDIFSKPCGCSRLQNAACGEHLSNHVSP
jgi:hypothetical protein